MTESLSLTMFLSNRKILYGISDGKYSKFAIKRLNIISPENLESKKRPSEENFNYLS
jgi:hypothetical protein